MQLYLQWSCKNATLQHVFPNISASTLEIQQLFVMHPARLQLLECHVTVVNQNSTMKSRESSESSSGQKKGRGPHQNKTCSATLGINKLHMIFVAFCCFFWVNGFISKKCKLSKNKIVVYNYDEIWNQLLGSCCGWEPVPNGKIT